MKCYVQLMCLVSVCVKAKDCIYVDGICSEPCPDGTYGYAIACDYLDPEPTCNVPNPKKDLLGGMICDFSACYCEPPTVRDEVSKTCVPLKDCPVNPVTPRAPVSPRAPVTREPVNPKEPVTPREPVTHSEPLTPRVPSYIRIG